MADLKASLSHPNVVAWLRVIRAGETSQDDNAYRTMFGGGLFDGWQHPRKANTAAGLTSTAAGAYQFLSRTWDECAKALDLPDFSPESQDLAALFLTKRRGALQLVIDGQIEQAIAKCNREWASLPGSPYGQPTRTLAQALAVYKAYGGSLYTSSERVEKSAESEPMTPFLLAALPSIIEAIPKLARQFGSGSEVSDRNLKAAELVAETVTAAVGAANVQEAVEKLKSDPAAVAAATKAIDGVWYQITEAGGGGIDGARKADAATQATGSIRKSASFWIALVLVPLVYLIVLSLIGMIGTATWSDDVRAGLAGSLISAIIGGLVGYYYGQTTSRNRT